MQCKYWKYSKRLYAPALIMQMNSICDVYTTHIFPTKIYTTDVVLHTFRHWKDKYYFCLPIFSCPISFLINFLFLWTFLWTDASTENTYKRVKILAHLWKIKWLHNIFKFLQLSRILLDYVFFFLYRIFKLTNFFSIATFVVLLKNPSGQTMVVIRPELNLRFVYLKINLPKWKQQKFRHTSHHGIFSPLGE